MNDFVPLPVAAAIAFHQADGSSKPTVTVEDYERALNLAACALSRLIAVHAGGVALDIDLGRQRFAHGATQLRGAGGVIEGASVSGESGLGASARRP